MKKFKYVTLTMAAALLAGFSSCSSDEMTTDPSIETGAATKMSLTITQPKTYADADSKATVLEAKVTTVDVYIYDAFGSFIKRVPLTTASHFSTEDNVIYTLTTPISTTTGTKSIYVGINLPSTLATAIEGNNPAAAIQTAATAGYLQDATNGFAMFSKAVQTKDLVVSESGSHNKVEVTVARLLSKVIVARGAALTEEVIALTGGTIEGLQFGVSNVNTKFFALPAASAPFKDPNYTSPWADLTEFVKADPTSGYKAVNAIGATTPTTATAVYTTENTSAGSDVGDHTYVSVRGTYTPTKIVKLATPGDGTTALVADATISAGTTFYLVTVNGVKAFFTNPTDATAYNDAQNGEMETYTNGVCYYATFLNPAPKSIASGGLGEDKYDVLRNTIYTVTINSITGIGTPTDGIGTGIPGSGKPGDPLLPIGESTNMLVNVEIEAWNSVAVQNADLQGK